MDDFEEGALNEGADASPADGIEEIADAASDQVASGTDADTDQALNEGEERGPVPYERFNQVNSKYQELSAWGEIVEALRKQGFDSPAAVRQAIDQRAAEQAQANERDQLALAYQQRVDTGVLDLEVARQQMQTDLDRRALERDRQQLAAWSLDRDVQDVTNQYPEADTDYVKAMAQATGKPVAELAKQSHERAVAYRERVISEYTTDKGKAPKPPEGSGGKPPAKSGGVPQIDDPNFEKWFNAELAKTQKAYR